MQLKPIFIQKGVPALVFSWQLSEIFNNNVFWREKKALLLRKKALLSETWSAIYRKSNYATFYLTSPRLLYFSTVHSDNGLCIVLSVGKKSPKVVNNTPANGLWRSLTCQNSHADITPLILTTDLINIYALLAFHFLSVSHGPTSILSDILITIRKSHATIFVGHFWKITNTCERCFWDVLVTSG